MMRNRKMNVIPEWVQNNQRKPPDKIRTLPVIDSYELIYEQVTNEINKQKEES